MSAVVAAPAPEPATRPPGEPDQRVFLHDVSWADFETLLAIRGDRAGVRVTYLAGELELMSPSIDHERLKKTIARMVETYADERDLDLSGYGSWTVKKALRERGVEPDECYVLGTHRPDAPDLAIEVIWTRGGLDKMEVYRGLGVKELWLWRSGRVEVHLLRGDRYEQVARSELLPDLDLDLLMRCLDEPTQPGAVRAFRKALRDRSR